MKTKTSVTLDGGLLQGIDEHASEYRSRSEFIEAAVGYFIQHIERQQADQRDLEILNRRADALNEEAGDVLTYQVTL
jgi:metal-responsive CopG/Arc/MetJ family transcriptional regulator